MKIADTRDKVAELVRDMKEQRVRSCDQPDRRATDIHNVVHGWRGEEPVVALFPFQTSKETALGAARAAAVGFGCDVIALTAETYRANTLISPLTGQRWVAGEMHRAVEEHGALEAGWVSETLLTTVVNRAGDVAVMSQSYRIHQHDAPEGGVRYDIEWLPLPALADDGAEALKGGPVTEALTHFMNEPPLDALMARTGFSPADFGLDAVEARAHADCVVVKKLHSAGLEATVMLLTTDPKRSEIIGRSLADLLAGKHG